jgi:hypothetical protein
MNHYRKRESCVQLVINDDGSSIDRNMSANLCRIKSTKQANVHLYICVVWSFPLSSIKE